MLIGKTIAWIAAISSIAVFIAFISNKTSENFWNIPSRTWKVEKVMGVDNGCGKSSFFQTPNFQSILSPRFSNVNYGPYIRTMLPPYEFMAVPQDPLNKECPSGNNISRCGGDSGLRTMNSLKCSSSINGTPLKDIQEGFEGVPLNPRVGDPTSYANGNFHQVQNCIAEIAGGPIPTDTVAEGTALMMGENGEMLNPIVYDRYIVANRNSRLRSQGDKIRGDLPIAPNTGNWFTPSVHPNIDLEAGALNVLAGVNNDTSKQLANLIYNSSGRADTTIGGVDMAFQTFPATSAGGGDITITGFP